jgi:predicted 2-oxoglutarate/Fe(II)-dependent dioxygenase YbiX
MSNNLRDYVLVINNAIDKDTCERTLADLANFKWQKNHFKNYGQEVFINPGEEELYTNVDDQYVVTDSVLLKNVYDSLAQYVTKFKSPGFAGWNGFSPIKFNQYRPTAIMTEHCDHIHGLFDGNRKGIPILSVIGLLNDDYTGGEFVMFGNEVIKLVAGDILIFPSVFMYTHRVEPVTLGVRNSFVSWVW